MTLQITQQICISDDEIELSAIRAQGAGGQHVNKTSTAIHLKFDVMNSSLSEPIKSKLLKLRDSRITEEGVVIIKSQQFRSQEKNRSDALERLADLIRKALVTKKVRKKTKPSKGSQTRRMDSKTKRGQLKAQRRKLPIN